MSKRLERVCEGLADGRASEAAKLHARAGADGRTPGSSVKVRRIASASLAGFCVLIASVGTAHATGSLSDNGGNGTLTVSYTVAGGVNAGVYFCASGVASADCRNVGGSGPITYYAASVPGTLGTSPYTFSAGSSVTNFGPSTGTTLPAGTYTVTYWETSGDTVLDGLEDVVIGTATPNPGPADPGPADPGSWAADGTWQAPPPWVQGYGRSSSAEACLEGWSPSYAAWPNGGTGGWTCQRTLVYNASTKKWVTS